MKIMTVSMVLLSCCLVMMSPMLVGAQTQFPYPPPLPTYAQSYYQPYQPYYQQYQPYYQQYQPYQQYQQYQPYQQYQQYQPYQQYQQYQPYQQPCESAKCYYPPSQPSYCWSRGRSGQEQLYRCGLSLVQAHRYYEAIQTLQNFLRYYPHSSLADNALYWIGECYYAQKHYRTALSYFQRVQYEYPRGNKVSDAMLKTALSYLSLKQYDAGCRTLDELIAWHPRSEAARKAYYWLDRCRGCYRSSCSGYDAVPEYSYQGYYGAAALPKNW